jgi:hypothetical protein
LNSLVCRILKESVESYGVESERERATRGDFKRGSITASGATYVASKVLGSQVYVWSELIICISCLQESLTGDGGVVVCVSTDVFVGYALGCARSGCLEDVVGRYALSCEGSSGDDANEALHLDGRVLGPVDGLALLRWVR